MNRIISLVKLDMLLIVRNKILLIAAVISVLYAVILQVLPETHLNTVLITLIFTDPVMFGFLFTGVMVLFERSGNTLQALSVSPVRPGEYLLAKALTLTLVATLAALVMSVAGAGMRFSPFWLLAAVALTSVLFIFLGFVGVSKVKTFNQYFIFIPMFFVPAILPFLGFFNIYDTPLWYLIPTQASLILFEAAFEGISGITWYQLLYSLLFLPLCIGLAFLWAQRCWMKMISQ
jgi:fluoroquinolone transport system permease protein